MRDMHPPAPEGLASEERTGDRLIALFLLGAVLWHPLVIGIFDAGAETTILGVPLLFVDLFAVWLMLIVGLRFALAPDKPAQRPASQRRPHLPPPSRDAPPQSRR